MQTKWVRKGKVVGPLGWISLVFIFIFLILVSAVSAASIWYQLSLQSPGTGIEKIFVVKKGDSVEEISQNLADEGLIKDAFAFRIYLFSSETDEKIEAGSFRLNSNQTAQEIAEELQRGQLDKWITLVEGLRIEEIASKLSSEFELDESKFINLAREGYMFPDTYLIPVESSEKKVVSILGDNFDAKVNSKIKNQAKKNGLTLNQLVILASIVERESKDTKERPVIAGILLKRFKEKIPIAADATIQYALGYQRAEKSWWKKDLTIQDLKIESLYNTRKVVGLPPSPICNPGLSSIKAVANPTDSAYYYYIHGNDGKVRFAKTFEEHNSNIAKYLN